MSYFEKSIIRGTQDAGTRKDLAATAEGHLEVAVHSPRLPFGSIHAEELTPVFQVDGVYGINPQLVSTTTSGTGTATTSNSAFVVTTGTTTLSQGIIQSRKRLRYRAGQGVVGRFAGLFTTGVASSYQIAGFGHPEDGYYFGYKNTQFGILHINRGVREIQTLTVTTGATSASNVTITLNGTAFTVPVTAASNIQRTVYEIATYTGYTGWKAEPNGATVIFIADSVGDKAGTMSFGAGTTGAAASFAETRAGSDSTETFIAQSSWNGDKLDGTGTSGVTLDPTKGNVYEIGIQYLGFGDVEFKIELVPSNTNNPEFITVHTIKNPNVLTDTHVGNPSFPFTMAAYSAGSTTNLTVKVGSFAGFIEGHKFLHGPRFSYFNSLTTVGATNLQALFTIFAKRYYSTKASQVVINMLSILGAVKHTSPVIYYLIKDGTLAGNPNFTSYSTYSATSWDTAATTVTYTDNNQLILTMHVGDTGDVNYQVSDNQEVTLQPGEYLTLAARSVFGNPSYVTGSINTREDQ